MLILLYVRTKWIYYFYICTSLLSSYCQVFSLSSCSMNYKFRQQVLPMWTMLDNNEACPQTFFPKPFSRINVFHFKTSHCVILINKAETKPKYKMKKIDYK